MNRTFRGFSNAAMDRLVGHRWPRQRPRARQRDRAERGARGARGEDRPREPLGARARSAARGCGRRAMDSRAGVEVHAIPSTTCRDCRPSQRGRLMPRARATGRGEASIELDWDLNRSVDALKRRLLVAAVRESGEQERGRREARHPAPIAPEDDEAAPDHGRRAPRGRVGRLRLRPGLSREIRRNFTDAG